jgi:hypothetical protein
MYRFLLIIPALFLFSGCVNKHGISAKYYSDCKEYYDLQGYYHKDCGEDDIMTYKEMGKAADEFINGKKKKPEGNVIGIVEGE